MQKRTQYGHDESLKTRRFVAAAFACTLFGVLIGRNVPADWGQHIGIAALVASVVYIFEAARDIRLRRNQNQTCRLRTIPNGCFTNPFQRIQFIGDLDQ